MHNVPAVTMCHAGRDTSHDVACFGLGQYSARVDVVQEVAVLSHLHHEVDLSRSLDQAIHSEDVAVVDELKCLHLSREELCEDLSRGASLLHDLDSNLVGEKEK